MPIKPENKALYPEDWPQIRERIKTRAGNRCERCGIHNHAVGYRDQDGKFNPFSGTMMMDDLGNGVDPQTGITTEYKVARELASRLTEDSWHDEKYIIIVCTVAHLDHDPRNCSDDNLQFLCQRCHNRYDRKHRDQTRKQSRMRGQLTIPEC